jgi:hypothetical protein
LLQRHEDYAEPALADLLEELVRTDDGAPFFALKRVFLGRSNGVGNLKKGVGLVMRSKERLQAPPQLNVFPTMLFEERDALARRFS